MNSQESTKLETRLLAILKKHLKDGDCVVAGISGGPDSIFLLYLLSKLPIKIIVAHVNHQLRKEADKDEEFVREICNTSTCNHNEQSDAQIHQAKCARAQILPQEMACLSHSPSKHSQPCPDNCMTSARADFLLEKTACLSHSIKNSTATTVILLFAPLTADITVLSQKSKLGLEETGRKVRYDFFNKLAKKNQAKFIITAHHADDNLETIILNFARGASLQGLAGMQEKEECEPKAKAALSNDVSRSPRPLSGASLLRPLLTISKKQILDFLHLKKLKFRIDKSNNSLVYKRNFIRHKIVPLLKEINPNIATTLSKNTKNLQEINDFLKTSAREWIEKNAIDESKNSCVNLRIGVSGNQRRAGYTTKTFKKFPAKNFRTLPSVLQKNILLQLHEKHLGHIQNIQSSNLEETLNLINKNIGNKKKKFGLLTISLKNNIISL